MPRGILHDERPARALRAASPTRAGLAPRTGAYAPAGGPDRASGLPCQNSHKCTEPIAGTPREAPPYPTSARRTAFALQINVSAFVERYGLAQTGFLTLTFAEHITDARTAQRRLRSLRAHVLSERYLGHIRVMERQKSGRIHYHLLVALDSDIRSGVDFAALARRDYRSAPESLRAEWAFWRRTAKAYGFGRTELLPVMSSGEAIGRYVGKYISKHLEARERADRGVKLVAYSGVRVASSRFAWAGGGAVLWRRKLAAFVHMLHDSGAIGSPTVAAMRLKFGPRWAFHWRDCIHTFPLEDSTDEQAQPAVA